MRITVTLDDDNLAVIRRRMTEHGTPFTEALNDAIRESTVSHQKPPAFATRVASLGVPTVDLDRAVQLAADLEDENLIRRQR